QIRPTSLRDWLSREGRAAEWLFRYRGFRPPRYDHVVVLLTLCGNGGAIDRATAGKLLFPLGGQESQSVARIRSPYFRQKIGVTVSVKHQRSLAGSAVSGFRNRHVESSRPTA